MMNQDLKPELNQKLQKQYDDLLNGAYTVNAELMNARALDILKSSSYDEYDIQAMDLIIKISNVLYNNTNLEILPIEDGIYDACMVWATKNIPNYQVGAPPTNLKINCGPMVLDKPKYGFTVLNEINEAKEMEDLEYYYEKYWFTDDLLRVDPNPNYKRNGGFITLDSKTGKSYRDTAHLYPDLVGTLDKYKFVLSKDAHERNTYQDSNVSILERDFFGPHIQAGILDPNRIIDMCLELKMDGVSIEAEVCGDEILSARTRGDTNNEEATDMTHIFKGWKFFNASHISKDTKFGMKFECMMSNLDLARISYDRDKYYKNPRNTISGILGSNDAKQWIGYMTLIPLETSLDIPRDIEVEFMNQYYSTEPLRYVIITGRYIDILYKIKKFCEEAEYVRPIMPYIYDGVVVRYMDEDIIKALGRQNYVNKWCAAVKFNAQRKNTIFLGYTYSVGQDGVITPIAHYNPVELFGNTHTKTTVHSYKRFNELCLRKGDIVSIELVNDVIPYITKPDVSDNEYNIDTPIEKFPTMCPECGCELIVSESGKSIMCPNMDCPGRTISRVTNMLSKLGVRNFSEATVRLLKDKVYNLTSFLKLREEEEFVRSKLGPVETINLLMEVDRLNTEKIEDYKLIGSLGFTGIAQSTWRVILAELAIGEINVQFNTTEDDTRLYNRLISIDGVGPKKASIIVNERKLPYMIDDLRYIDYTMKNVIRTYGNTTTSDYQIRFSGIRNKDLIAELAYRGFDISDGNITKKTNILVIPYKGYESNKTRSVSPDCKIYTIDEFMTIKDSL